MKKTAIVLTAFGTATSARATYNGIEKKIRQEFPDCGIFWSFTSTMLRKRNARQGIIWKSPAEILNTVHEQGYERAVVQSLHIVPGFEYEKIVAAARAAPLPAAVGRPLLGSEEDCSRVAAALSGMLPDSEEQAAVLAGHGTRHAAGAAMYGLFNRCLREHCPRRVYVSMVEGEPSWPETCAAIRESGARSVLLIPFMLVAGEHIMQDVLGDSPESWRSSLAGFDIAAVEQGLGCNEKILAMYADHLRDALCRNV